MNFDELRRWDREHVWHAFTQMAEYEPLLDRAGRGCTLVDVEGREYLDGVSSLWCNVHGHRHPKLDAAIREQLDEVAHVTLLGMAHPTTIKLARRLVEIAPAGLNHVFFSDDGATAVEVALKMAFQYWRQALLTAHHSPLTPPAPNTSPSTTPTTATRWAASASAAWPASTRCSGRCCSTWFACPRPTCIACRRA